MKRVLLDANVLIALWASNHVHHDRAAEWFDPQRPFATCSHVEMSYLRFVLRTKSGTADEAVRRIEQNTTPHDHEFWTDELRPSLDSMRGAIGHRQVTDFHLVAIARSNNGRIATMDAGLAAAHADVVELLPD